MNKKQAIADSIKDILTARGLKKNEFAELMSVQPSNITKWLSGTHNFTLETLIEIETYLNCTIISVVKPQKSVVLNQRVYEDNLGTI